MTVEKEVIIEGLTVKFGNFTAVDNVSFSVDRGSVFGFLGANGAGKTTTIRVMCGLLVPSAGSARIAGLGFEDGGRKIKERVGYMSQKFTLYDDMTVTENLNFKAALRRLPDDVKLKRTKEAFDLIGFSYSGDTMVKDLPSGVKQQVSLAATLLHDPEIIFLDEPTSGVSPSVRAKFWELIKQLSKIGKTVIVTTHYMDEAEQCGRIALMRAGKLIALDSPSGLKTSAYPEPLAEITFDGHPERTAVEKIASNPVVLKFWPHGLKYHAVVKDEPSFQALSGRLPAGAGMKRIVPSLEDVFIRLVEGKGER